MFRKPTVAAGSSQGRLFIMCGSFSPCWIMVALGRNSGSPSELFEQETNKPKRHVESSLHRFNIHAFIVDRFSLDGIGSGLRPES